MFFAKLKENLAVLDNNPFVRKETYDVFLEKINSQKPATKLENNPEHFCAFFLPVHRPSRSIYLGHHIKANDWIPPGGHLEKGELPRDAVIREMEEELGSRQLPEKIELFNISIKPITNHPKKYCTGHYDWWHAVWMSEQTEFDFDRGEFYDARWFSLADGLNMIAKNPDFKQILSQIDEQLFS